MKIRRSFLEPKNSRFSLQSGGEVERHAVRSQPSSCQPSSCQPVSVDQHAAVAATPATSKPVSSLLLCSDSAPVTNFTFLMKKFGETELSSSQNHESYLHQDSHQNSGENLPFNCEKIERTSELQITGKHVHGTEHQSGMDSEPAMGPRSRIHSESRLEIGTDRVLYYDLKKADYLAPTPPSSDYEELSINATSPGEHTTSSLSPPDILSPPLSIGSGLDFPNSPLLHYHPAQSPTSSSSLTISSPSHTRSPLQSEPSSSSSMRLGRYLSSSPLSTLSDSPIPADFLSTSPISEEFNQPISTTAFSIKYQDNIASSQLNLNYEDNLPSSPISREFPQSSPVPPENLDFCKKMETSPSPGQSNTVTIKQSKCSFLNYSSACVQSFSDADTIAVFESKDNDTKYSKSREFLLNSTFSSLASSTSSTNSISSISAITSCNNKSKQMDAPTPAHSIKVRPLS